MSVLFTVVGDGRTEEYQLAWGEQLLVRSTGPVTVFITSRQLTEVESAGRKAPLLRRPSETTATVSVDGSRTTGAIRIQAAVRGEAPARLDVLQASAELALEEFLQSIRLVELELPRLRGGFVYLDAEGIPRRAVDPLRVASFLIDNASTIERTLTSIGERPQTASREVNLVRPPGANVNYQATRRFLLQRPEFMQPTTQGAVEVAGQSYAPSLAIVRQRRATLDTLEHRRIARFVARLWSESDDALSVPQLNDPMRAQLRDARSMLSRMMTSTFLGDLSGPDGGDLVLEPTALEASEPRYRQLHSLRSHYLVKVSANADTEQLERQHLARPDEIYQALCATLVAAAFELELKHRPGSPEGVMYANDEWELWVNRVGALPSWRSTTAKPDAYRPDLVLRRVDRPLQCILLDAKHTGDSPESVPGEQLKEVQAYLNAFGVNKAGILFPGPMSRAQTVAHADIASPPYLIREIPLRAVKPAELRGVLALIRSRCLELEDTASITREVDS